MGLKLRKEAKRSWKKIKKIMTSFQKSFLNKKMKKVG